MESIWIPFLKNELAVDEKTENILNIQEICCKANMAECEM